ncbi:MAG: hypothetical protein GY938_30790 [Ketobacter sp.]|nr:hypothetical protein [Ketobacter sp.]
MMNERDMVEGRWGMPSWRGTPICFLSRNELMRIIGDLIGVLYQGPAWTEAEEVEARVEHAQRRGWFEVKLNGTSYRFDTAGFLTWLATQ